MKKLILLLLMCFMVTGCGSKSTALNENKAYKQEDVIETTAEQTTEETEAEIEYAISSNDLIERISTVYPDVNSDMIKSAVEEDYNASLLYYYNALKTNKSDSDMTDMLRRVVAGEGFVYSDGIVVSDIDDIAYDVSFVDTAESSYKTYKDEFIYKMSNRIYEDIDTEYSTEDVNTESSATEDEVSTETNEPVKKYGFVGNVTKTMLDNNKLIIVSNDNYQPTDSYLLSAINKVNVIEDEEYIGYILLYPSDTEVVIIANQAIYDLEMNNDECLDYTPGGFAGEDSEFYDLILELDNWK